MHGGGVLASRAFGHEPVEPNCGVRLVGKRLYCEGCHSIRVSSGVTPSKPVRSDLAALAFEAPESLADTVPSLTCTTEGSPMSGEFRTLKTKKILRLEDERV